jgi:hypothetical protein
MNLNRTFVIGSAAAFAAAAAALALAMAPPAGATRIAGPRETAAHFLTRVVSQIVADDYAHAWTSMHPVHQAVAPRSEYVACELQTPIGSKLRSVDVLRVAEGRRRIPGEPAPVRVTSVTLRLAIVDPALRTPEIFAHTFTAVAVGNRWTWILPPSRYALYRSDGCGVPPARA